jgi:hypothetical protein
MKASNIEGQPGSYFFGSLTQGSAQDVEAFFIIGERNSP